MDDVLIDVTGGPDVEAPPLLDEGGVPADRIAPAPGVAPDGGDDTSQAAKQVQPFMEDALMFAFRRAAERRGEHWLMERDEAAMIAEPAAEELMALLPSAPFLGGVAGVLDSRRGRLALALAYSLKTRIQEDVRLTLERAAEGTRAERQPVPIRPRDTGLAAEPLTEEDIAQATLDARAAGLPRKDA
ncbi:MAG: hypothetical protein EPO65_07645 [Dehalococcoidia bacterium]|nr:MAG: hypothetical protein EPO65_07645 [Dehalococcoidia bacterium]